MATVERFEELKVWQKARELCREINQLTQMPEFAKDYSLKDQIKRSSGSVMDNVAEGFDRQSSKEFRQFLFIAKGSCSEVKSQLYRAVDVGYISDLQMKKAFETANDCGRMIGGLIKYLNTKIQVKNKVGELEIEYGVNDNPAQELNLPTEFFQP